MTAEWVGPASTFFWDPEQEGTVETGPFVVRLHWANIDGTARLVGIDLRSVEQYDRKQPPKPLNKRLPAIDRHGNEVASDARAGQVATQFAEITSKQWRAFKFSDTVKDARAALLDETEMLERMADEYPSGLDTRRLQRDAAALQQALPAPRKRPGRPQKLPDSHFEKVAKIVKEVEAKKGRRYTLGAIQRAFGGPDVVTRNQAAYWRKRAADPKYQQRQVE
jgi:hypothetical protein